MRLLALLLSAAALAVALNVYVRFGAALYYQHCEQIFRTSSPEKYVERCGPGTEPWELVVLLWLI
jgi:hypothetical protein